MMMILDVAHILKGLLSLALAGCIIATTNGWLHREEGR